MEVTPLKNLFFVVVLKLETWRIPLDTTKKFKECEKPSLQCKRIIYKHYPAFILEWTWKVAFPLIRKNWDDQFASKVGNEGF